MPRVPTLATLRARAIAEIVADELARFFRGERRRRCAYCGRLFHPRHSWHFFCRALCRRYFYRGAFRPRLED